MHTQSSWDRPKSYHKRSMLETIRGREGQTAEGRGGVKLEFHDADTDTDTDILARILARK